MIADLRGVIGNVVKSVNGFSSSSKLFADRSNTVAAGDQALGATVEEMSVVADEARKLAERSSQATKEISKPARLRCTVKNSCSVHQVFGIKSLQPVLMALA